MVMLNHTLLNNGAGYLVQVDRETGRALVESDLRQCAHCAFTWQYRAGSGILRGFCQKCNGHLCGKRACMTMCYDKRRQIDDMELAALNTKRSIEAAWRQLQWREAMFG